MRKGSIQRWHSPSAIAAPNTARPPVTRAQPGSGRGDGKLSGAGSETDAPASTLLRGLQQVSLLAVALAGLVLLPARLSGALQSPTSAWKAGASYALYLLFFASGTLSRMARHGALAPRTQDKQRSGTNRAALVLFAAVVVPAGHFAAWWDASLAVLSPHARSLAQQLLPPLGYALMTAGWALNAAAASALGQARSLPSM